MKMKKIAVLGAGAVGSYVIWGLSKRDDISLGVVAEGERANRLKNGCIINGVTYHPEVWTPQEAQGAISADYSFEIWCIAGCIRQYPHDYRREYSCNEPYEWCRQ